MNELPDYVLSENIYRGYTNSSYTSETKYLRFKTYEGD